jgi:uncharacterized protein (DUF58 family)
MAVPSTDLLKKIRRIQIQTTHLANDVLAGAYRSAFKGKGMEFEEVREYQQGDDIRSIDWNVTARMSRPYVKNFREERELSVILAVDVSASTRFGSGNVLKSDLIAEIAAVLAFSAIKNQDKVALLLFSDKVEKYFPPKKGTRHVLRIIRELLTYKSQERATNISEALSFLGKVQARSGVCFLISDFICPDFFHEAALAAKRYDLVPIAIIDPAEKSFPKIDLVTLADLESGVQTLIDTNTAATSNQLQKNARERLSNLKKMMQKLGTELCMIDTHLPYTQQLKKYFSFRLKKYL